MRILLAAIASALMVVTPSQARTVHVPSDQPTISDGLGAAAPGDTVLVSSGVYDEWNLFIPSMVVLMSESGPDRTVIDGTGTPYSGATLWAADCEVGTTIEGFTVRGGIDGVLALNSAIQISHNVFLDVVNAAVNLFDSSALVKENLFLRGGAGVTVCGYPNGAVWVQGNTFFATGGEALCFDDQNLSADVRQNLLAECFVALSCVHCDAMDFSFSYNDVWSSTSQDYFGVPDQTGLNGNLAVDPLF